MDDHKGRDESEEVNVCVSVCLCSVGSVVKNKITELMCTKIKDDCLCTLMTHELILRKTVQPREYFCYSM